MTDSRLALVIGLFVVPAVLLWLGHRMRRHSDVRRRVFWGATIGYVLGMLLMLAAIHYPPVLWAGGGWRTTAVHWGMVVGAVVGAGVALISIRHVKIN
jgi:L-cystine uptake protein TcyP (sodium:dicarboxylate symporter family)